MFGEDKNTQFTSRRSPSYDLSDKGLYATLITGASMMVLTIAGMLLVADTQLASLLRVVYTIPVLGVLVFGVLITVGRHLGMKGVKKENTVMAIFGAGILIFSYSWFGGGILTPYEQSLYLPAIVISGAVTIAITLLASAYVYSTDKNLEHWSKRSGYLFMGGIGMSLVGSLFTPILVLASGMFLLGFIADLVYEVWMTSHQNRPAYANGIALYVAFAGVFVHILQIVLQLLSER